MPVIRLAKFDRLWQEVEWDRKIKIKPNLLIYEYYVESYNSNGDNSSSGHFWKERMVSIRRYSPRVIILSAQYLINLLCRQTRRPTRERTTQWLHISDTLICKINKPLTTAVYPMSWFTSLASSIGRRTSDAQDVSDTQF